MPKFYQLNRKITGTLLNGDLSNDAGKAVTESTRCLEDQFTVTNAGGRSSDVLCGTNTGQHRKKKAQKCRQIDGETLVYVETDKGCTDLSFQLGTDNTNRNWNIKITQYSCDSPLLAPPGCTQYYYGSTSSEVQTFNFNNGQGHHLANQEQTICVRRERGQCRLKKYALQ